MSRIRVHVVGPDGYKLTIADTPRPKPLSSDGRYYFVPEGTNTFKAYSPAGDLVDSVTTNCAYGTTVVLEDNG